MSLVLAALASVIVGIPTVADGDTININGQRIRIHGIDALEAEQQCVSENGQKWGCGGKATQVLAKLINGQEVVCVQRDIDQYNRIVATCRVGSIDIGAEMVRQGWAVAFTKYAPDYEPDQRYAQARRNGVWAGKFDAPMAYRAAGRAEVAQAQRVKVETAPVRLKSQPVQQASGCVIKGNINRKGERIYHMPSTKWYVQTRAEAMFCSEAEARAAGFRKAIVK